MYVYTVKMYCRSELTQHTVVHLLATYLPTFFLWWIKKNEKKLKIIEVITPTENHVYAKFLFSQYQIMMIRLNLNGSNKK